VTPGLIVSVSLLVYRATRGGVPVGRAGNSASSVPLAGRVRVRLELEVLNQASG
jgi:hypothetical protein